MSTSPQNTECSRFVQKLSAASVLPDADQQALAELCTNVRVVRAKRDIISEGDEPEHIHIVLDGWAARYRVLQDGSRQITALLLPGDICDLHVTILARMDHSIMALTDTRIAFVAPQIMENLSIDRPQLGRALWRATLIDEAVLRSWIVNLGRRPAEERIAHLFCELHARLSLVGLVDNGHFSLPLTQEVIADSTGLTGVHINRMLQKLRNDGAILLKDGQLTILDVPKLAALANFDSQYLHREQLRQT